MTATTDDTLRNSILDGLNPEQAEAARHGQGPLLIIAGGAPVKHALSCIASPI